MACRKRNLDKCFEDSQEIGVLTLTRRNMKEFPVTVDMYDLTDVVKVDLSHNKFTEIPGELSSSFMMELLNCSYNNLRNISDLSHISSLTQLDLSHNQIQTLPVHLCSLPLKTLILNNNRLDSIPGEIGLLGKLQHLDLSCNELTGIPSSLGELIFLRILNLRRNYLHSLPDEISKMKYLVKLDISCNNISVIPPAFRLITSLIILHLKDNPLTSPPAQICLRGKLHIFKYLSIAAQKQDKSLSLEKDPRKIIRKSSSISSISSSSLIEQDLKLSHVEQISESQEVLNNSKLTAKIQAEDQKDANALETVSLAMECRELNKNVSSFGSMEVGKKDKEGLHEFHEKSTLPLVSPKPKMLTLSQRQNRGYSPPRQGIMSLDRANIRKYGSKMKSYVDADMPADHQEVSDIAGRKEELLKMRKEALLTKQKLDKIRSEPERDRPLFDGIGKRSSLGKGRTGKILKEGHSSFTIRRICDSEKEEFQQIEKLRTAIETRLQTTLPDDLPAALADGVVLCHLVNHVCKSTIPVIHVPSGGMPKLTMPKCLMNVDAFIEGCRKLGVNKSQLCSPADVLEEKNLSQVCLTVHALLQATSF